MHEAQYIIQIANCINFVDDGAGGISVAECNRKKRRIDYLNEDGITRR